MAFGYLLPNKNIGFRILFFYYYSLFYKLGWKKALLIVLIAGAMAGLSDVIVNLFKDGFQRLRPNRDPEILAQIRNLLHPGSFSFVSGHATTSMAVSVFFYLTVKKYFKAPALFFIWPILFAYSRIYLGVHYPLDILLGMVLGLIEALIWYQIAKLIGKRIQIKL